MVFFRIRKSLGDFHLVINVTIWSPHYIQAHLNFHYTVVNKLQEWPTRINTMARAPGDIHVTLPWLIYQFTCTTSCYLLKESNSPIHKWLEVKTVCTMLKKKINLYWISYITSTRWYSRAVLFLCWKALQLIPAKAVSAFQVSSGCVVCLDLVFSFKSFSTLVTPLRLFTISLLII